MFWRCLLYTTENCAVETHIANCAVEMCGTGWENTHIYIYSMMYQYKTDAGDCP